MQHTDEEINDIAFLKRMKSLYELASPIGGPGGKSKLDLMIEKEEDEHMRTFLIYAREGAKNGGAEKYQKEIEKLEKIKTED